jgi:hypothetical protein
MITEALLNQVVAFEYKTRRITQTYANDIYTLHFQQWWKRNMTLKYDCRTTGIGEDGIGIFERTDESVWFHNMLINHMNSTYQDYIEPERPEGPEKCVVLELVQVNKETEEETE